MSTVVEDIKRRYIGPNAHFREQAYCDFIANLERQLAEAQGKLDAVGAMRERFYAVESYIADGGHRGWMYNSSPFLIPYVLDRILHPKEGNDG